MQEHLLCRAGRYYLNRRIPVEYQIYDTRKFVRIALKTDSRKEALKRAVLANNRLEAFWLTLVAENDTKSPEYYHNVANRARLIGFSYKPVSDIADGPLTEIFTRLAFIEQKLDKPHVEAVIGGVSMPQMRLEEALEKFWEITKDRVFNKSENQIRKWRNPRVLAIKNLIKCVGNKNVTELTREDIMKLRDWWLERVKLGEVTTIPANKNLIHVKNILETVSDHYNLKIDKTHLFKKMLLPKNEDNRKAAFETEYIRSVLFNEEKLCGLNREAKNVLYAFSETGAGLAELVGLQPEDILLEAEIPHIAITPRMGNGLKTKFRRRTIPLVGYALDAFKAYPRGFIRYAQKPDSLSATLNKYLRENEMLPTDRHSVNSLRHSFQNRLVTAKTQERIQAELMGHKFHREKYGDPTLAEKLEELLKIQLKL